MSLNLQTTTAVIDENGILRGLEPLLNARGETVQIVVIRVEAEAAAPQIDVIDYETSDPTPQEWNKMLMQSSAFKEWADPAEDIYTLEDGEPIVWDEK